MLVLSTRANSRVDVGNPSSIVRHPKKVTSLVEVGTSGLLPSWEYLFDHLSKYVSEQESHAILNGIRDKIRFAIERARTKKGTRVKLTGRCDPAGQAPADQ